MLPDLSEVIGSSSVVPDVVSGAAVVATVVSDCPAVSSGVDSRVILDQPGAERLLGRGDMLFQAPDAPAPARLQGVFVSDTEIQQIVSFWRQQYHHQTSEILHSDAPVDAPPIGIPLKQKQIWEEMEPQEEADPMFDEALDLIRRRGRASISMLQRRLRIGYTRAARMIEQMEAQDIISPPEGPTQHREVLDYGPAGPPADE